MSIIHVIFAPRATFERIRERGGGFVIPLLVLIAVCVITFMFNIPFLEKTAEQTAAERNLDVDMLRTTMIVSGAITAPVIASAMIFIVGLLLLLVNLIVRGDAKYFSLVKVALLSTVPGWISSLLTGVLARMSDVDDLTQVSFSLGAFMTQKEGFLYGIAQLTNPFSIWQMVLLVIGTSVMANKPSAAVGWWIIIGWVAIQSLVSLFL